MLLLPNGAHAFEENSGPYTVYTTSSLSPALATQRCQEQKRSGVAGWLATVHSEDDQRHIENVMGKYGGANFVLLGGMLGESGGSTRMLWGAGPNNQSIISTIGSSEMRCQQEFCNFQSGVEAMVPGTGRSGFLFANVTAGGKWTILDETAVQAGSALNFVCEFPRKRSGQYEILLTETGRNMGQCEKMGGWIASIRSERDQRHVNNILWYRGSGPVAESLSKNWAHLGGHRIGSDDALNRFVWQYGPGATESISTGVGQKSGTSYNCSQAYCNWDDFWGHPSIGRPNTKSVMRISLATAPHRIGLWQTTDTSENIATICEFPTAAQAHAMKRYSLIQQTGMDRTTGKEECQKKGGWLATIPTRADQELINIYLSRLELHSGTYWIGLAAPNPGSNPNAFLQWTEGPRAGTVVSQGVASNVKCLVEYCGFTKDENGKFTEPDSTSEDYGAVIGSAEKLGTWGDVTTATRQGAFCEFPIAGVENSKYALHYFSNLGRTAAVASCYQVPDGAVVPAIVRTLADHLELKYLLMNATYRLHNDVDINSYWLAIALDSQTGTYHWFIDKESTRGPNMTQGFAPDPKCLQPHCEWNLPKHPPTDFRYVFASGENGIEGKFLTQNTINRDKAGVVCEKLKLKEGRHQYFDTAMNRESAATFCKDKGGWLPTPVSFDDVRELAATIITKTPMSMRERRFWLGGERINKTHFHWDEGPHAGKLIGFSPAASAFVCAQESCNWKAGYPKEFDTNKFLAASSSWGTSQGMWENVDDSGVNSFLCEFPTQQNASNSSSDQQPQQHSSVKKGPFELFYEIELNRAEAARFCGDRNGGWLATITSPQQQSVIEDITQTYKRLDFRNLSSSSAKSLEFWIGGISSDNGLSFRIEADPHIPGPLQGHTLTERNKTILGQRISIPYCDGGVCEWDTNFPSSLAESHQHRNLHMLVSVETLKWRDTTNASESHAFICQYPQAASGKYVAVLSASKQTQQNAHLVCADKGGWLATIRSKRDVSLAALSLKWLEQETAKALESNQQPATTTEKHHFWTGGGISKDEGRKVHGMSNQLQWLYGPLAGLRISSGNYITDDTKEVTCHQEYCGWSRADQQPPHGDNGRIAVDSRTGRWQLLDIAAELYGVLCEFPSPNTDVQYPYAAFNMSTGADANSGDGEDAPLSYTQAEATCKAHGGWVATVPSNDDNRVLSAMLHTTQSSTTSPPGPGRGKAGWISGRRVNRQSVARFEWNSGPLSGHPISTGPFPQTLCLQQFCTWDDKLPADGVNSQMGMILNGTTQSWQHAPLAEGTSPEDAKAYSMCEFPRRRYGPYEVQDETVANQFEARDLCHSRGGWLASLHTASDQAAIDSVRQFWTWLQQSASFTRRFPATQNANQRAPFVNVTHYFIGARATNNTSPNFTNPDSSPSPSIPEFAWMDGPWANTSLRCARANDHDLLCNFDSNSIAQLLTAMRRKKNALQQNDTNGTSLSPQPAPAALAVNAETGKWEVVEEFPTASIQHYGVICEHPRKRSGPFEVFAQPQKFTSYITLEQDCAGKGGILAPVLRGEDNRDIASILNHFAFASNQRAIALGGQGAAGLWHWQDKSFFFRKLDSEVAEHPDGNCFLHGNTSAPSDACNWSPTADNKQTETRKYILVSQKHGMWDTVASSTLTLSTPYVCRFDGLRSGSYEHYSLQKPPQKTWAESATDCAKKGGWLPTIINPEDHENFDRIRLFVMQRDSTTTPAFHYYLAGYRRIGMTEKMTWKYGPPGIRGTPISGTTKPCLQAYCAYWDGSMSWDKANALLLFARSGTWSWTTHVNRHDEQLSGDTCQYPKQSSHQFTAFPQELSYEDARATCMEKGGDLAILHSSGSLDPLQPLFYRLQLKSSQSHAWIRDTNHDESNSVRHNAVDIHNYYLFISITN